LVRGVIAAKVKSTDGRISAKRFVPIAQAAGYAGSARNFRQTLADAKKQWRRDRRKFRRWLPTPGESSSSIGPTRVAGMCSVRW
jgi:hypothetical protein